MGYGNVGGVGCGPVGGFGGGNVLGFILVLFILLVIISRGCFF
ncbi:sporulation protein YjcZ [Paenibacillus sp. MWE-103]|uniref:Sporulation protein YjcZ n=1 Tax=Paenibacillus artemisiicola TaxID=1172618 RepID=A0ABS3W836_9BACL|nr:sporulation protein YjcZ [Paenibacillus artemisiicola]MBO7744443.1 sporulation protein YjcZ [Paenibacillus artemisiicola]